MAKELRSIAKDLATKDLKLKNDVRNMTRVILNSDSLPLVTRLLQIFATKGLSEDTTIQEIRGENLVHTLKHISLYDIFVRED
jgi:hypothetical protein